VQALLSLFKVGNHLNCRDKLSRRKSLIGKLSLLLISLDSLRLPQLPTQVSHPVTFGLVNSHGLVMSASGSHRTGNFEMNAKDKGKTRGINVTSTFSWNWMIALFGMQLMSGTSQWIVFQDVSDEEG
jgi:hypothetical protein